MSTYPPSPVPLPALHSRPAAAARSSAPRNPAYAPWKGVMQVQPRRGFHVCFFSRLWGGPADG